MFAWFFLSALYLQQALKYSPLLVGLTFLPTSLLMAVFSLGLSAKVVMRFGIRASLTVGLLMATVGLLLLARAPVHGNFLIDVLHSMMLFGFDGGLAFNPMLLAAMGDVKPDQSGVASGLVNTASMMGGALGLAILVSLSAARTSSLLSSGVGGIDALNSGYHAGFLAGAIFAAIAVALSVMLPRSRQLHAQSAEPEREEGQAVYEEKSERELVGAGCA